ncbi:MAG TPA: sugar phosphate nucleotidyltransferase [Acidobacteriota bacterium]|nr:sugar phosphate nucleotidyltransferase [Acidobacteriota bacterium]
MRTPWVVILAGGEGMRVRALTRAPDGEPVPKQFCVLQSGESLFRRALARALALTHESRVVPVVSAEHRRWWERDLRGIDPFIVVAQQEPRGTAHAILAALVAIARRDPEAVALVIPSDNMIDDEGRFHEAAVRLCVEAWANPERVILLGVVPERADPEYGWIVPDAPPDRGTRRVLAFVEKPGGVEAEALRRQGALVSTFVTAVTVRTALSLFRLCLPDLVGEFRGEAPEPEASTRATRSWDFSHDFLAHTTSWQRVMGVESCGWCDLGTPERLRRWLAEHGEKIVWKPTAAVATGVSGGSE